MIEEAKKIASTFHRLAELPVFEESPCEVLSSMAVVLRTRNTEMVCLDISVSSSFLTLIFRLFNHSRFCKSWEFCFSPRAFFSPSW